MIQQFTTDELLPQRPPFVMIDRLVDCDDQFTETELSVITDNLFCMNGKLREAGVVENIAQTCAARLGYISLVHHIPVQIGFIGAIRDLVIHRLPCVGERLATRIELLREVLGMTLVRASVTIENEIIASCEMKIAIKK